MNSALTFLLSEIRYLIKLAIVALGSPLSHIAWLINRLNHIFTIHDIIYTSQLLNRRNSNSANQKVYSSIYRMTYILIDNHKVGANF